MRAGEYTFPTSCATKPTVAKTVAEIQGWATSATGKAIVRRAPRRGTMAWREQLQLRKAKLAVVETTEKPPSPPALSTVTEGRYWKEGTRPAATPRRMGMGPPHSISPASRHRRHVDASPETKPAFGMPVRDTLASKLRKQRSADAATAAARAAAAARASVALLRPTACCNYYCSAVREQVLKQKGRSMKRRHAKLTAGPPFTGLSPHARRVARAEWMKHKGRFRFRPEDDSLPPYNRSGGPPCVDYTAQPTGTKRFNLRLVKQRPVGQTDLARYSDEILVCRACFFATRRAAEYQRLHARLPGGG